MTGESGFAVSVHTIGATACTINRYPSVTLKDGTHAVPFTYLLHQSGKIADLHTLQAGPEGATV